MKIKNKKTPYKKIILSVSIVIGILIIILTIAYIFSVNNENKIITTQTDKTSSIKQEQAQGTSTPNSDLPQKTPINSDGSISESKSKVETPTSPPEKPSLDRADQVTDGSIKIVATLKEASKGYCELQLSKTGSQTISHEAYIVLGSMYYSCSFNVPRNEMTSSGQWNAVVIHHIGSAITSSDLKTIEVN